MITLPLARSPRSLTILALAGLALAAFGARCPPGLDIGAYLELRDAGVNRYVGQFHPVESESFGDWTLHRFDPQDGEGPICLDGTPFTVFSRVRDPKRAIVYFAGGGACWQGMYACSARARTTPPDPAGIFVDGFEVDGEWIENPLADWSLLYVSACDGSFFGGDNDVVDPDFSLGGVRHHRGVRNATAALDLARQLFPGIEKVLLAGTSAGGYGVEGIIPLIARFEWLNFTRLYAFSDSGPAVFDPANVDDVRARMDDWGYARFYPSSCEACTADRQPAELLRWLLDRDSQIRSALYTTDADIFVRYYLRMINQARYRALVLDAHDPIHAENPERHRRFIRSASEQHGVLPFDLYYSAEIEGVSLRAWLRDFVDEEPGWTDLVEDLAPVPDPWEP